jgi:hypothetical protein
MPADLKAARPRNLLTLLCVKDRLWYVHHGEVVPIVLLVLKTLLKSARYGSFCLGDYECGTASVVQWSQFLATDPEVPGSICGGKYKIFAYYPETNSVF